MRKSVWIERLSSGYSVRYWTKGPDGVFHLDRAWFKSWDDANKFKAQKKLSLLAKAQNLVDPTLRPSDLFHTYLQSLQPTHRQSTLVLKNEALKKYINGLQNLNALSPKKFCAEMIEAKYSINTVAMRLRELRAFVSWLIKENYLQESPFKGFTIPAGKEVGRKLELNEIQKIWEAASEGFKLYLAFLIYTGARRNEIKLARWADINIEQGIWTIPTENSKTHTPRSIPLDTVLLDMLKDRPKDRPIFPQHNLRRYLNLAIHKAGIEGRVRIHDFRHTFASHWNGDPRKLMDKLGWASPAMLKRYSHFTVEDIRKESSQKGIAASLTLGK